MNSKRITLFMGHYGSGKTFTAVNYAIYLKKLNNEVTIYDLDIVNPYFRTIDAEKMLKENAVELIVSPFAETNVDIPAMNSASYKMVTDLSRHAVVDVGGDDRGALALGRFSEKIKEENNYDALLVLNKFRPETKDIRGVVDIINEINYASKIPFTGIVNNGNLGNMTDESVVLEGYNFCKQVSKELNLPIKFSAIREDLITTEISKKIEQILPIKPIKYGDWL